ncbi:hypothetical protein G6011_01194 [Alternaria panax]|uniref:Heterokaryon incompatibility domain-containing protein n=1 Tax=Alternaria panax TaxID=48097 RepID=A0AAD4NVL8_9PLEO|nr:hypothetical protein G6011_01194 [Alternaria panax]
MRLLQRQSDGSFQLVDFMSKDIPPYAILSHTWGAANEEVSFRDLTHGTGTAKAGYRKITFCADQAAHDELEYFWIDTCCIDKSSSAELQEAINSMFHWYKESAKCYVYLSDVPASSLDTNELAFQKSKWFTRGWTLQELLAPEHLEFFSAEGKPIGSKSSRVLQISELTRIPTAALQQTALSQFTVEQRMAWTEGRQTTRPEDMAYSLLGIFDIQIPHLYGEGRDRATNRLREEILKSQRSNGFPRGDSVVLQSDYFVIDFKEPTMLHETDAQFALLMSDSNKRGRPDLFAVKKTGSTNENIEVNILYGDEDYKRYILRISTPNFTPLRENWPEQLQFALTDWTGDGTLDLVVIKKFQTGTNSTEVHIFSGADKFQRTLLQVGTPLEETYDNWTFGMGKWANGKRPDLFAIKKSSTGTNATEVHVLSGDSNFQEYVLHKATGLHETDSKFDFIVTDWDGDGRPDLVAVKKSETNGRCTEVHVLSGSSSYQKFILRAETPVFRSDGMFEFAVADWTGNGKPALIGFRKRYTGSNTTEVHVMRQRE